MTAPCADAVAVSVNASALDVEFDGPSVMRTRSPSWVIAAMISFSNDSVSTPVAFLDRTSNTGTMPLSRSPMGWFNGPVTWPSTAFPFTSILATLASPHRTRKAAGHGRACGRPSRRERSDRKSRRQGDPDRTPRDDRHHGNVSGRRRLCLTSLPIAGTGAPRAEAAESGTLSRSLSAWVTPRVMPCPNTLRARAVASALAW